MSIRPEKGIQQTLSLKNSRDAVISEDGTYRYRLTRSWNIKKATIAFVMLNPSTANAFEDDPTIRRCINFAKDWGYGSLVVANLFALRATDPSKLDEHPNPIGPKNETYLQEVCDEAAKIVVAWGSKGSFKSRAIEVTETLGSDLYALNTTKDGHPTHPLYQPKDTKLEPWTTDDLQ